MNFTELANLLYEEPQRRPEEAVIRDWAKKFFHWLDAWVRMRENTDLAHVVRAAGPNKGIDVAQYDKIQKEFLRRFKNFMDHIPAVVLNDLKENIVVVYGQPMALEKLTGLDTAFKLEKSVSLSYNEDYQLFLLDRLTKDYLGIFDGRNMIMPTNLVLGKERWDIIRRRLQAGIQSTLNKDNPGIDLDV